MNHTIVVAQANGPQGSNGAPGKTIVVNKPQGEQSITIHLDGATKLDLSAIANEQITLVHLGDRLIILFDNHAQVTVEPFYGDNGQPLADLTIELAPGRDVSGADFAGLFPVTTDASAIPASGGPGAVSSGANFGTFTIDALSTPNPLPLLGPSIFEGTFTELTAGPLREEGVNVISLTGNSLTGDTFEGGLITDSIGTVGNHAGEPTVVSGGPGSLNGLVNFGPVGPGATPFQFVSTAAAETFLSGLHLTSQGMSVDHVTIVGNNLIAGTDPAQTNPHDVFSLTINSDGSIAFTLLGPVDDANPGHLTPGPAVLDQLTLDLSGFIQAVDAQGNTLTLSHDVFVNVHDDAPVLITTIEPSNPGGPPDGPPDGPVSLLAPVSGDEPIINFVGGTVEESALTSGTPGDLFGSGTGGGTATVTGHLDTLVAFGADGPDFDLVTHTYDGFQLVSHDNATSWLNGLNLTSHGQAVDFVAISGDTMTAWTGGGPGAEDAHEVFSFTLNGDGTFTFTLINPLDHPDPGHDSPSQPGIHDSLVVDMSGFVQAVDFDGDAITLSGDFGITIVDDIPQQQFIDEGSGSVVITVDEGGLTSGAVSANPPGDLFGNGNDHGAPTSQGGTFSGTFSFGADGPDIVNGNVAAAYQIAPTDKSLIDFHITSHGEEVDFVTVTNNLAGPDGTSQTLTAWTNGGRDNDPNSHEVFTLTVNGDGTFTFQLINPIDHPDPGQATPGSAVEDTITLDLSSLVAGVDFDGDAVPAVSGTFVVDIVDDIPITQGNLVQNGDFSAGDFAPQQFNGFTFGIASPGDPNLGWTVSASDVHGATQVQLERVPSGYDPFNDGGVYMPDGHFLADMEASPGDIKISQVVHNIVDGQQYSLEFFAGAGFPLTPGSDELLVFWGNQQIADIIPGSTPTPYLFEVTGGANDAANTLTFEEVGASGDFIGTYVADVALEAGTPFGIVDEGGLASGTLGDQFGTGNDPKTATMASGSLAALVSFGADGPAPVDAASTHSSGGFQLVDASTAQSVIAGLGLTSHGQSLDNIDIAIANGVATLTASTSGEPGHEVFTLTLDESTGAWTFTLINPLDNPHPPQGVGEDSAVLDLSGLVQAVDFDGDAVPLQSGSFKVDVIDDVPVLVSSASSGGNVDEGGLDRVSHFSSGTDLYGDGNDPHAAITASGSLSGLAVFGADGPSATAPYQFVSTTAAAAWIKSLGLTSHGDLIDSATLTTDSHGNPVLTFGTDQGDHHNVFKLALDQSTGAWTFTLINPIDHPAAGEDVTNIDLSGVVQAVDFDGDAVTLSGDFSVNVKDDVPVLDRDDSSSGTVDEGALHFSTTVGDLYGDGNDHGSGHDGNGDGDHGDGDHDGDDHALAVASGSLQGLVDFGADGPNAHPFRFVSSEAAAAWIKGLHLTSHGDAIDTAALTTDSHGNPMFVFGTDQDDHHSVFALALDPSTGHWTFTLLNPIDHPADHGENTQSIDLSGLVQAVDFDGDPLSLSRDFSVTVIDDKPELTDRNASGGVDEGALTASSTLGDLYGNGNDIGVNGASATAGGTLSGLVAFGADGQSATAPYRFVSTSAAATWIKSLGLFSHGDKIDTATLTTDGHGNPMLVFGTDQDHHSVFELVLNQSTGAWTFTLLNPIDHSPDNGENTRTIDLSGLVQAFDFDGDAVTLSDDFTVTVKDDVPVLASGNSSGTVDEGGLTAASHNDKGDLFGSGNDPHVAITASGSISGFVNFGADGPDTGTVVSGHQFITVNEGYQFVSEHTAESWLTSLNHGAGLFSHGERIDEVDVSFSNGVATLTASTDHHDVFTLQLNETTGAWTFTLINPIDHPVGNTENTVTIDLSGLVHGVDFDGDAVTLSGDLSVTVIDDVPVQVGNKTSSGSVDEGGLSSGSTGDLYGSGNDHGFAITTSGSLSPLVSFGADGPQDIRVTATFVDSHGHTHFVTDTIADGFQFVSASAAGSWLNGLGLTSHGQAIDFATLSQPTVTTDGVNDSETQTLTAWTTGGPGHGHEVFTLTLDVSTGAWTFTLINPIDDIAGNGENAATLDLSGLVQAIDFDGDAITLHDLAGTAATPLGLPPGHYDTLTVGGATFDGLLFSGTAVTSFSNPGDHTDAVNVSGNGLGIGNAQISDNEGFMISRPGTDAVSFSLFNAGNGTTSVTVSWAAYDGATPTSTSGPVASGSMTVTVDANGDPVVIDPPGSFDHLVVRFDLSGNDKIIADNFSYTAPGNVGAFTVTVTDDVPLANPNATPVVGAVDEGALTHGTDSYGSGNDPTFSSSASGLSGSLQPLVKFGADGPAPTAFQLVNDETTAGAWLSSLGLNSHGFAINAASINGSTLTALDSNGDHVFTLTVSGNGSWAFTLLEPIDHPNGAQENTQTIDLSGLVQGVDFDGDAATLAAGAFKINVTDDVPVLVAQTPVTIVDGSFLGNMAGGHGDFPNFGGWGGSFGAFDTKGSIDNGAWTYSASPVGGANDVQLERVGSGYAGATSSNGAPMVDLEASPGNIQITQAIANLTAGEKIEINFEMGEANFGNAKLAVLWDGQQIATYDPQSGPTQLESLVVTATGNNDAITFREIGQPGDNTGTYITNVSAQQVAGLVDEGGLNLADPSLPPSTVTTPIAGNDPGAATVASGTLAGLVSFGADGPAAGGGFHLVAQSSADAATEVASLHLSSLGSAVNQAILVGNTITAAAADGHEVFSLTLNGDGSWTFKLLAPLDDAHAGEDIATLDLSSFIKAVDFDGDAVTLSGDFKIAVIDDVPVANTSATVAGSVDEGALTSATDSYGTGNDPALSTSASGLSGSLLPLVKFGADGPAATAFNVVDQTTAGHWLSALDLTSHGFLIDHASISGSTLTALDSNNDKVFTLTVNGNGSWTFNLLEPIDHPAGGTPENTATINLSGLVQAVDGDGDAVTLASGFSVTITDDAPVAAPAPANLLVNGSFEDGHSDIGNGQWSIYTAIPGWTSGPNGVPFEVQVGNIGGIAAEDGQAKIELDSDLGGGNDGNNHNQTGHTNATIEQTVTTVANDTYELTFWYSPRADVAGTDSSSFKVFWDGAVVDAVDSTPISPGWHEFTFAVTGTGSDTLAFQGTGAEDSFGALIDNVSLVQIAGVVDEGGLGNGNDHGAPTSASGSVASQVSFGADGPTAGGGFALAPQNDLDATSLVAGLHLSSHGSLVDLATVNGNTLAAFAADGHEVFTLAVNPNGTWSFTLLSALDDPANGEDALTLDFSKLVTATDFDGDTVLLNPGTFTVAVIDDVPIAHADSWNTLVSGTTTLTGLLGNDAFGADGVNLSTGVTVSTAAAHGTVTYDHNGDFIYTPNAGYNGQDSFAYTITDGDGDTSTTTVALTDIVTNTNTGPTAGTVAFTVDEDGLPGGVDGGPGDVPGNATTHHDTLVANFNAEGPAGTNPYDFASISGHAVQDSGGHTVSSGGSPLTYFWDATNHVLYASTNADNATDAASTAAFSVSVNEGTGAYDFTLLKPLDHPLHSDPSVPGSTAFEDNLVINIPYTVTDHSGGHATGTLAVTVNDDSPSAINDSAAVNESSGPANLVLVLDTSTSMQGANLTLEKNAAIALLNTGEVNQVMVVDFNSNVHTSGWVNVSTAISYISGLSAGGSTNYDIALQEVENHFADSHSAASQTIGYFLSDGDPNEPSGSIGINASEEATWTTFLSHNGIGTFYGVTVGSSSPDSSIAPIAYPNDAVDNIVINSSHPSLLSTLPTLINTVSGNVLTNDHFGADGGRILSATVNGTTYTWDGNHTINETGALNSTLSNATSISVTTTPGGHFDFFFTSGGSHTAGDWDYSAPSDLVTNQTENFGYALVDGDGDVASATLAVTVTAVDDPPVNTVPGAQTVAEDAALVFSTANHNAISVSDVDANGGAETVTLKVGNGTLTLATENGLTVTGDGSNDVVLTGDLAHLVAALNGLTYQGSSNFNGSDTLTITTNDNGHTGAGGPLSDTDTVAIAVTAVNDPPVATITQSDYTVDEKADLTLSHTGLSIGDPDAGNGTMTVTLSVTEGTLSVDRGNSGLASQDISGNNSSTVTIHGTITEIDNLLGGIDTGGGAAGSITYVDNHSNPSETATLTLTVNDNGNTGAGGPLSDSETATIHINHPPVANDDTVITNAGTSPISIPDWVLLLNDTDPDSTSLSITSASATSGHGDSASHNNGVVTFTDGSTSNHPGGTISYSISDGSLTDSATVTVTQVTGATLTGTSGGEILIGGAGSDTLIGNGGGDVLIGGGGSDHFRFNATSDGLDHILDFATGDSLDFAHAAFGNLPNGTLSTNNFVSNTSGTAPIANNANPQFIFNQADHTLYYDADGSGAGAAIAMAKIENNAPVHNTDIHIVT